MIVRRPVSWPQRRRDRPTLVAALALTTLLATACGGPVMPNTVIAGTTATVGWSNSISSTNPGSVAGATAGGLDVAALTRSQFAERVEGAVVVDEAFGTVEITDAAEFTVRYDLAEPAWSDGIPLDAADLLLAWAAGSNALAPADFEPDPARDETGTLPVPAGTTWFDAVPTGLHLSDRIPVFDEFERWIDVRYADPVEDWQTALNVAVPAHVVGQRAFGLEDPMEAKQAVISAIVDRDDVALAAIAEVWNTGFLLGSSSSVPQDLLLSSGPYRVAQIDQSQSDAQQVHLVVNTAYVGTPTGQYERIELIQTPSSERLEQIGSVLDVAQVVPTAENWEQVRELERTDFHVTTSHDGSYWALVLRTDAGDFRWPAAREAFFGAVPRSEVAQAGAGPWAPQQEATDVLLFAPGTSGYEIALEDAGFRDKYELSEKEAVAAREEAGVEAGTGICVLYDTDEAFAVAAVAQLAAGVQEEGWTIQDCGSDDIDAAAEGADWEAVLLRLPVPQDADEIAALWGTDGSSSWSRIINPDRDALITELASTADGYEARDLRVAIEASLVADAIALPLAMSMVVTVADRDITGAVARPGAIAPLTANATEWEPIQ